MFSVLLVSNPSTNVVENPFQVQMPATIEELQGVAAGLSEVVIGLVNTIQQQCALLQAHTTASTSHANSADTTSGSNNQHLTIADLTATQPFANIKPRKMILPNFRSVSKHLTFPPKFACRSWNNRLSVSGRIQCYLSAVARKGFLIKPPRSN